MKLYSSFLNKYEQGSPNRGAKLVQLLKKFWQFSLYYGEFISSFPEKTRRNLK
jgi:hypothetical protein